MVGIILIKKKKMFENDSLTSAQRAIRETLISVLQERGIEERDINKKAQELLKIHGLDKDSFNFISNVEKLIELKLNDVSIDDNSNKNEKTVKGLLKEVTYSVDKIIGYRYLYRKMVELYGKDEARVLSGQMYDLSLGLSDATSILTPYCYSLDASKLVLEGRQFGQLWSKSSKRLSSYISALCETVHQISSHLAGAIAIGSFFLDCSHLLMVKQGYSFDDLKNSQIRKTIENEFQQLIHSLNHLSRNGIESPFTNISVFDRSKLRVLVDDYTWYFEPNITELGEDYVVEYIMEVQRIFLDLFDKGDPTKNGLVYRFPIVTINLSKNGEIKDQEFLDDICKRDIFRYNIFASEGTKVASCCRLISDSEMMDLASQSNSFGGGSSISLGSHRVCTLNLNRIALESKSYSNFYETLYQRVRSTAKILKAHKELIKDMTDRGLALFISNHWLRLDRMFSTFGIIGLYECEQTLLSKNIKSSSGDWKESILKFINKEVSKCSKEFGIIGNIEQIPGESFAIRLAEADKILFGADSVPYNLYSNQYIPLWERVSIWDRMEMDGKYNRLVTGGGIVHITIGEKLTATQSKEVIEFAINSGCEHFALNSIYTKFEDGSMLLGKFDKNPQTLSPAVDYYTRVVGFWTPISSWSKTRREKDFPNRYIEEFKS